MKNNLEPMISDQFREFLAACEWSRQNMGKIITEWPSGWEVTTNLEEDTTVNMSPYKEAIQNAESPKQKAAKNKISDLTRK
jgi:hypothetical protein